MTDTNNGQERGAPAYVAYQTLKTFFGSFKEHGLPNLIDKSVLRTFSGGVQSQLKAGLRFLDLVDADNRHKPRLKTLVEAFDTDQWKDVVADLLKSAYPEMFRLALESASPSEFSKAFKDAYDCDGDTLRKAQSFFLKAAGDAGIKISPYILQNTKARTPTVKKAKPQKNDDASQKGKKKERTQEENDENDDIPDEKPKSIAEQLLEKFPPFDPAWNDDLKANWFDGYKQLLGMGDKK